MSRSNPEMRPGHCGGPNQPAILRQLLKQTREALRYQSLDDLIGRKVTIASPESGPEDVFRALKKDLPMGIRYLEPDANTRLGAVVKYGMLDLTFEAPIETLGNELLTIKTLREWGYESQEALEILAEDLEQERAYLRVLLATELTGMAQSPMQRIRESRASGERAQVTSGVQGWKLGFPEGFWPRPFSIDDACFTNAPAIWLFKHFYM